MSDFNQFYQWGQELWLGKYTAIYPLPIVGLFGLFSITPQWVSAGILSGCSLILFILLFKRKSLLWVLYIPILQVLVSGQLDLLFLALYKLETPLSLALMTLKPQLFVFALPNLICKPLKFWRKFILWCIVLYLPVTLARPTWVVEWLHNMDDGRLSSMNGATLLAFPASLVLLAIIPVLKNAKLQPFLLSLNPGLRGYDYTLLSGTSLWLIPASWILQGVCNSIGAGWPLAILGVVSIVATSGGFAIPRLPTQNKLAKYAKP